MTRFLFTALHVNRTPGLVKLEQEMSAAASQSSFSFKVQDFSPAKKLNTNPFDKMLVRFSYLIWLLKHLLSGYSVISRFIPRDPLFSLLSFLFPSRLFIFLHTNYKQEHSASMSSSLNTSISNILFLLEDLLTWLALARSRVVFAVTPEISSHYQRYSKRSSKYISIPNRRYFSSFNHSIASRRQDRFNHLKSQYGNISKISIIFIAGRFQIWHGLDRLLAFMNEPSISSQFRLTLIGDVSSSDKILIESTPEVYYYSSYTCCDIDEILLNADLAISSLALDRINLNQACPLKVREYLQCGIPVIGTHAECLPESFPFYKHLQTFDSGNIISYFNSVKNTAPMFISGKSIQLTSLTGDYFNSLATSIQSR